MTERVQREARLRWVPIAQMRVSPVAQREKFNQARIDAIAADLDVEQLGALTVNLRDGHYYVIDGNHRRMALIQHGWGDQQVQCWTYEGLTEEQEAEIFLKLNDYLAVSPMDRFRVGVTAGREKECDIDRIVRAQGLVVSRLGVPGAVAAVGTLHRIYERADGKTLGRALRIIRDAYGDGGLDAPVIDGIGYLCQRYNGELDDPTAVTRLANMNGGVNGLLGAAERIKLKTGKAKGQCVAAAAVEVINRGKGGKKLPSWWKDDE